MRALFICLGCGKEKHAEARSAGRQAYCGAVRCQRARKAAWQRQSLESDADHRANQRRSQEAWRRANPRYWTDYRRQHPEKAERNRRLQHRRDRRRRQASAAALAKMDALDPDKPAQVQENQEYWLVPVLAKKDALRVKIVVTADT
jgi:hypothetical protein